MSSNVLRSFICILICLTAATAFAQKQGGIYSVKGTLVDSLLNESEPYATVRISSAANPDEKVKLSVTDEKGRFNERLSEPGDYVITVSCISVARSKLCIRPLIRAFSSQLRYRRLSEYVSSLFRWSAYWLYMYFCSRMSSPFTEDCLFRFRISSSF